MKSKPRSDAALHSSAWLLRTDQKIRKVNKGADKLRAVCTAGGRTKRDGRCAKQWTSSSRNQKQVGPVTQQFHIWGYVSQRTESRDSETCILAVRAALFTPDERGK